MKSMRRVLVAGLLTASLSAAAQETPAEERLALRYQATVATQAHPAFEAPYSGANSLSAGAESATSVVMDLAGGARLWPGAEAWFQAELAGGRGLSSTLGVAAFPSGEVYRVGDPSPTIVPARLFLRQVFGLGGGSRKVQASPNQLAGSRDRDALIVTAGKIATSDIFDNVPLSNDPHTRFTSWGLWASAAYDYPADVRGYTWGAAAELSIDWWSVRAGVFLEPKQANGEALDWHLDRARGLALEGEVRFSVAGRPGAVRALGFLNTADMGSYRQAVADGVEVPLTRAQGRTKLGGAASVNQQIDDTLGAFLRVSANDGRNESWAFTEIDRSVALGVVQGGARWARSSDEAGAALVVSGLSADHRDYLAAGGHGFLLGDGGLRSGPEILAEIYYRLAVTSQVSFVGTYQPIVNPGFNRDRGPVHVFTARGHVAF